MTLPPGTTEHRAEGDALPPIRCAVLTVSDSRTLETDESGKLMQRLLGEAGHTIADYALLKNDEAQVRGHVRALIGRSDLDAVLITGGTGLGSRDRTVEAVRPLLEKEFPVWRDFSSDLISGSDRRGGDLSRAVAGSANGKFVVSMPGSKAAVELALTRIILPELRHAIRELRR